MSADERGRLDANLVGALKPVPKFIQVRQTGHFCRTDPRIRSYGSRVAAGLGIDIQEVIGKAAY
jgi:catalase